MGKKNWWAFVQKRRNAIAVVDMLQSTLSKRRSVNILVKRRRLSGLICMPRSNKASKNEQIFKSLEVDGPRDRRTDYRTTGRLSNQRVQDCCCYDWSFLSFFFFWLVLFYLRWLNVAHVLISATRVPFCAFFCCFFLVPFPPFAPREPPADADLHHSQKVLLLLDPNPSLPYL